MKRRSAAFSVPVARRKYLTIVATRFVLVFLSRTEKDNAVLIENTEMEPAEVENPSLFFE